MIVLRGPEVSFTESCKCQKSDLPQLTADGASTTIAGGAGYPTLTWGFEGDALDCKIEPILDGSQARITAGRKTGSVTVVATTNNCTLKGVLALVCAENTCTSGECSDFGNGEAQNSSVDLRLGLGRDSYESIGGFIALKATVPGATLATPNALRTTRLGRM